MRREKSLSVTAAELARRLKAAREACQLKREDVAKELAMSDETLAAIEAGKSAITSRELEKIAYLCGCSVADFFGDDFPLENLALAVCSPYYQKPRDQSHLERLRQMAVLRRELENLRWILQLKYNDVYRQCREYLLSCAEDSHSLETFRQSYLALVRKAFREGGITMGKLREVEDVLNNFCGKGTPTS